MSEAKISILPSSVMQGCPTEIESEDFKFSFIGFSNSSPTTSTCQISQPKLTFEGFGHRVKNMIFLLESKQTDPSFCEVFIIPLVSIVFMSDVFPLSSYVAMKISINL